MNEIVRRARRPRSVSDADLAQAVGVRLRPGVLINVDRLAAASNKQRSAVIRQLVEEGLAGRAIDEMKRSKKTA